MSPKILITGGNGTIAGGIIKKLAPKYGASNIVAADVRPRNDNERDQGVHFEQCDVVNLGEIEAIVKKHSITWLFHLSAVLSAAGEAQPLKAIEVNMRGFENVIEIARRYKLRIFLASSSAVFGSSTPKENVPDVTIMKPNSIYGVTKIHNELVGEYYHVKFGVDFRCLRYVSLISEQSESRGRINDFAVELFKSAIRNEKYVCDVVETRTMSFIYMNDLIEGTISFMEAEESALKQRVYNLAGFSASPGEIAAELRKTFPDLQVEYKPNEVKMAIIHSLPFSIDDSAARRDWSWKPQFNLTKMVLEIISALKQK